MLIYNLFKTVQPHLLTMTTQPISALLAQYVQQHINGQYVATGFHQLDALTYGFAKGELAIVGGRPCVGKTNLFIQLAMNMAARSPVLYANFDLPAHEFMGRCIAVAANLPIGPTLNPSFIAQHPSIVADVTEKFHQLPLYISSKGPQTGKAIKKCCKQHIKAHGVQAIFIDYLQMIGHKKGHDGAGYIGRMLKALAAKYNVCVIMASQLNRGIETRRLPQHQLSDLGESFGIELYADKVLFIQRPHTDTAAEQQGKFLERHMLVTVAKNRTGETGKVKLPFIEGRHYLACAQNVH
jgi:replicative DNA helicase